MNILQQFENKCLLLKVTVKSNRATFLPVCSTVLFRPHGNPATLGFIAAGFRYPSFLPTPCFPLPAEVSFSMQLWFVALYKLMSLSGFIALRNIRWRRQSTCFQTLRRCTGLPHSTFWTFWEVLCLAVVAVKCDFLSSDILIHIWVNCSNLMSYLMTSINDQIFLVFSFIFSLVDAQ